VKTEHYDLVLMDIQMPGMDGVAATQAIRTLEGPERDVPIIAMTASVFSDQISRFKRSGMDDHVGKPINIPDLQDKVARWLAGRSAGAGRDAQSQSPPSVRSAG